MTCPTYPHPAITATVVAIIIPFLIWSVYSTWREQRAVEQACIEQGGKMGRVTYSRSVEWQCVKSK